jgi:hypothetical protein
VAALLGRVHAWDTAAVARAAAAFDAEATRLFGIDP